MASHCHVYLVFHCEMQLLMDTMFAGKYNTVSKSTRRADDLTEHAVANIG